MRTIAAGIAGILCAVPLVMPVAAADRAVPFHGRLSAIETDDVSFPTILVNGTGSGNATHLGKFTFTFDVAVDLVTGSGPASVEFVAANGDSVFGEGVGQATDSGGGVTIVESYGITGGTGRFAQASGEIVLVRELDPITGRSSGSFDGYMIR